MSLLTSPAPSLVATSGFVSIVLATGTAIVAATAVASRTARETPIATRRRIVTVLAALAVWLALTAAVAATGYVSDFDRRPPPLLLVAGISGLLSTALALSPFGAFLARWLPTSILVGVQVFRVPLELVLHRLSYEGVLPVQMTFAGMNYDIVTGFLAGLVGIWATWHEPPRLVVSAWNALGIVLLATIVTIAMLSAPTPLRVFPNEPANTIVTSFPFIWLPTFLVQVAWIGHLLVLRRGAGGR